MAVERFCWIVLGFSCGTGGASSGVGVLLLSPRDFGLKIVDARRSLLGLEKLADPSIGAV
jgi:hypothetical protein